MNSDLKLVLLPGMDGSGDLFTDFKTALPKTLDTITVRYPHDESLSYAELDRLVRVSCPTLSPFFLLAESFSTPLAIKYAASNPANLKGLILCAGFASSPVKGWKHFLGLLLASLVFSFPIPDLANKIWLVGFDASPSLLASVRSVISKVKPKVLAGRLHAVLSCDVLAELGQVAVPIMYIQGKYDHLISASCAEKIKRVKSQMNMIKIEGPHLILQREPNRTAEAVINFMIST